MPTPATVHFLIGPVGAGKTTYGQRRCAADGALFLELDAWMVRLFGADARPPTDVFAWYLERRERCRELIWDVATAALSTGATVFAELGLLTAGERMSYFERAQAHGIAFDVIILDAPRETRRQRVQARNQDPGPHTQVVPLEFFERASDAWEPPGSEERERWPMLDA